MSESQILSEIARRWSERRDEWEKLRVVVDGAAIASEVISDLEMLCQDVANEMLTIAEAAELSGYSPDHLGRLIRTGRLTNRGIKGSPRVARGELPIRPRSQSVAAGQDKPYDPNTDARSLRVRR